MDSRERSPSPWRILVAAMLGSSYGMTVVGAEDYSCDAMNDTCPHLDDGECDSFVGEVPVQGCEFGDCFDCNFLTCGQWDFDCQGCVTAPGCFWCPTDGRCYNSNMLLLTSNDSCGTEEGQLDYVPGDDTGGATCPTSPSEIFSDPLYSVNAWVYDMIHVTKVWEQGIFGKGSRVRINDRGVVDHEEFLGRYDEAASCSSRTPKTLANDHGTVVASIIAAAGNNDLCAVGISPESTISSCLINDATDDNDFFVYKLDTHDISVNSWGYDACTDLVEGPMYRKMTQDDACPFEFYDLVFGWPCDVCDFSSDDTTLECEEFILEHCKYHYIRDVDACLAFLEILGTCRYSLTSFASSKTMENLLTAVKQGRDGKGIIVIFASGNSNDIGADANMEELSYSRLTIAVGGVGKDGKHASYSTPGAPILVSAPGGDDESSTTHATASVMDGQCTDSGSGTSFAAAVVAGVVALILEVNPNLTWKDVQGILVETSQVVNDPQDETLVINGAGFHHSNFYGFGIVNAEKAVSVARDWVSYGDEDVIVGESGRVDLPVKDSSSEPTTSTITISSDQVNGREFQMDWAALHLDLLHFSRGDLEVVLTSPSGTQSVLHPGKRVENTVLRQDERWKLTTPRNWGESPVGEWTLTLRDLREGDLRECNDVPFNFQYSSGDISGNITCAIAVSIEVCVDGTVIDESALIFEDNGMTLEDACCACGGGLDTTAFEDVLKQWRLVIYGRDGVEAIEQGQPTSAAKSRTSAKGYLFPLLYLCCLVLSWF